MTTFYGGRSNGYRLVLTVTETSTSVANNTSNVSWNLKCECQNAYAQWNPGPGTVSVTINGSNRYSGRPAFVFPGMNSSITLCSGTMTVNHNNDGSKSISCSASYTATSSAYYLPGNMSVSGNMNLTTIARATQPSVSPTSITMGGSITISTPRASSSFTHTLKYSFGGASGTIATGVGTSKAWTVPTSLATQIPNSTSGTGTITCETYNGSTLIGTKTCSFTATVPSSYVPKINSVTVSEATSGLASQFAGYVQSKSTLKVVTSASGSNGSTIKTCSVKVDGSTYTGTTITTGTINSSGSVAIVVTVTDSRGRTATSNKTISVFSYSSPRIIASTVTRADADGDPNEDGEYALCNYNYVITDVNGRNTHSFKIQYMENDAWVDMVSYTDLSKSGNYISTKLFSKNSSFQFRFVISDYFTTFEIVKTMEVSYTLVNYGSDGHSIMFGGQAAEKPGFFGTHLPFAPIAGQCIHVATGTSGSTGYVKIASIEITQTYSNSPVYLCVARRGDWGMTEIFIQFANASSADPGLANLVTRGATRNVYIRKNTTSMWDLYIQKAEAYDSIAILGLSYNITYDKFNITFKNEHATTVPSGFTQAKDIKLVDGTYPVGRIITTTVATNPGTLYGGTWEQFAPGRVLVGAGTGNDGSTSMTFTALGTGGEYRHLLSISELASHAHTNFFVNGTTVGWTDKVFQQGTLGGVRPNRTSDITTGYSGGNAKHNNVQPYIGVFYWRRVG